MHLCYNGRRFSDLGYECLVYLVCSNKASSHEKKRRLKMTNQSIVAGRRSIKAVLSTVIAILLIVATFTSTAFAQTNYRVQIVDGAEEITVTTNETEPIEILNDAGITLTSDDVIDITKFGAAQSQSAETTPLM